MENSTIRKQVIQGLIIGIGVLFIARLFYIQVIDKTYRDLASENTVRKQTIYPPRGLMYDRDGRLIVGNAPGYDIMVVPAQVQEMDTALFCRLLNISRQKFDKKLREARAYSRVRPSPFIQQVSAKVYAQLQEHLYGFPGFYSRVRTKREYEREIAAHAVGYVGEVDKSMIKKSKDYEMGDYKGISGLEKYYEKSLRGKKGVRFVLVDVHNRVQGSFADGERDSAAVEGKNLTLTIDAPLQQYGERLLHNKVGSIVALQPQTGEVLAMVSSPTYQSSRLVGRSRGKSFSKLQKDTLKPLFNRAVMAGYPPGSTIKPFLALMSLQENVITEHYGVHCPGAYYTASISVGCHSHPSPYNLRRAIQYSCNTYFCKTFRKFIEEPGFESPIHSLEIWKQYLTQFGFSQRLQIDLPDKSSGQIPGSQYYNNIYGRGRWKALTVISLAIGQGEVATTPVQLANGVAALANRGHYYTPHLVRKIEGEPLSDKKYTTPHKLDIDSVHYKPIIEGMEKVVEDGTAQLARLQDITICGKTGTSQNPHGKDHSVFIAFAPKDTPRIAIATVVENAGFGSTFAAPISSLMIQKYLSDSIPPQRKWVEDRMLKADLIHKKFENPWR